MALRTEAPSTGSQREPSRLEQNTNQRLTGHSHSPHQRDGHTPAQFDAIPAPRFTSYSQGWMNALILAATQEKLARAGTGKLKMRGPLHECVCVCFLCVCATCAFSEFQQIYYEWMMGNRLQTWSRIKACGTGV